MTVYPDPSQQYQARYYTERFADDVDAKIVGFRYCLQEDAKLFKGFRVRFETTSGFDEQTYGTMENEAADANNCFPPESADTYYEIEDDIIKWALYVDSNDVEGFRLITAENEALVYKANWPQYQPNPEEQLPG